MPTPTGYTSAYTSTEIDERLGAVANKADKIQEVNHGTSDTTFTLTPNVMHIWGTVASLTLTLPTDSNQVLDEYLFTFTSGSTPTTLSLPSTIKWIQDPDIEENKTYQVSIVNGLAGYLTNGMVAGSGGGGGGENNVIESISVNGVPQTVSSKNVDLLFKTINNESISGSGNIAISGGTEAYIYDIDASNLDEYGEKIVQSSTPYTAIHAAYQAGKTIYVRLTNNIGYPFILNMVSTNGFTEGGYEFTAMVQNGDATFTAHVDIGASEYYIECHQKFFLEEEEDPTVPSWAKQATKPTYTAQEVGALPSSTTIPSALSQLSDDSTHRVVTDSEKSTWNSKGTYSKPSGGIPASDIASGVIPTVPTNVSAFTNDANYVSSTNTVAIYSGSSAPSSSTGKNGDIYIQTS